VSGAFEFGPFGTGTPAEAPAPPEGLPSLCRYIDPVTGDVAVDATTGHLQNMPPVRQRFLLLMQTLLGSSSVLPGLGLTIPRIIDDSFARQVDAAVREGARQMTEVEKVARIRRVDVTASALGRTAVLVEYDDLTLGAPDKAVAFLP
jgi:phage baseplate assembly protein W